MPANLELCAAFLRVEEAPLLLCVCRALSQNPVVRERLTNVALVEQIVRDDSSEESDESWWCEYSIDSDGHWILPEDRPPFAETVRLA